MSRVRMPHNNRVSASAALRTNDMWSKTIGHDPYAAADEKKQSDNDPSNQTASLMLLAKMSNLSGVESRGGCKKCGMLGHMTFQCRNTTGPPAVANDDSSSSSSDSDSDDDIKIQSKPSVTVPTQSIKSSEKKSESDRKRSRHDSSDESSSDESRHKKSSKKSKRSKEDKKDKKHKHKKDKKHKHKKERKSSR